MRKHLASFVVLTGLAHAQPRGNIVATSLGKLGAKIKLYCENRSLDIKVDWPAYERLDFQALIAAENSQAAADPETMRRARKLILTGDDEGKGSIVMVGNVTGGANSATVGFEVICRDQPQLRAAAAKITTIVLEPITDMKYLADRDKIAFARRTNDWSAVHDAFLTENHDEWHVHIFRPRFSVSGTTLTVTQNLLGHSGDQEEFSRDLADALGGGADAKRPDPPPAERRAPPRNEPPPPPKTAKRDLGPQLDCDKDYADVHDYSSERDYATGALVFITFSAQPTTLYRCIGRSGCEKGDSLLGPRWTIAGHC